MADETSNSDNWSKEAKALQGCSLKVRDHQCFKHDAQGMECIKPINVIVGRNNSGKSAFIEAILHLFESDVSSSRAFKGAFQVGRKIDTEGIARLQNAQRSVQIHNQHEHFNPASIGRHLVGKTIVTEKRGREIFFLEFKDVDDNGDRAYRLKLNYVGRELQSFPFESFSKWKVLCVRSDREVTPERKEESNKSDESNSSLLAPNGRNLTRLFQSLMYREENNHLALIENTLVPALNEILKPDNSYERVLMRENHGLWEIHLDEKSKGPIPLSLTGSGIKTVLLVLANLLLIPEILSATIQRSQFVFAFEELENNLHPATLRRMFNFIRKYCLQYKCHFFITTHSHIVIDMFSSDENSQILHITHDGTCAKVATINSQTTGANVLDDLDVRASDILQTNVVVWVEGPTDAMFFERWVDIHSNGKLRRGVDYQCVFYGGSVVSHVSFDAENTDKLIDAVRICRHSIFIVDSNRSSSKGKLDEHAARIYAEVTKRGMGWITIGREIENYIPKSVIAQVTGLDENTLSRYTDIYKAIKNKRGTSGETKKVPLAHKIVPLLTLDNIYVDDLQQILTEACDKITTWNKRTTE